MKAKWVDKKNLRRRERGHSLLEVVLAVSVLGVAIFPIMSGVTFTARLSKSDREMSAAMEAAEQMVSQFRSTEFSELATQYYRPETQYNYWDGEYYPSLIYTHYREYYTGIEGDYDYFSEMFYDPSSYEVPGLSGLVSDEAGRYVLFMDETMYIPELGMPRDLNGDGDADDWDVSGDYKIVPAMVTVEWVGDKGPISVQLHTLLTPH